MWQGHGGLRMNIHKKLFALTVCLLLIPAVFAALGGNIVSRTEGKVTTSYDDDDGEAQGSSDVEVRSNSNAQMKNSMETESDVEVRIGGNMNSNGNSNTLGARLRVVASSDKTRLHSLINDFKAEISASHKAALEEKEEFEEKKEELENCKQNCAQAEAEVKASAQGYLGNSANAILAVLERAKARVEANEHISAAQSAQMVSSIDAKIRAVQQAQAEVESSSATKDEIRDAAQEINAAWKKARVDVEASVEVGVKSEVAGVLKQSEKLEQRLESTIDRMEAAGKDTSAAAEASAEFSSHIEAAQSEYDAALSAQTHAQVKSHLREAKEELMKARAALKEAVNEVRAAGGQAELSASANAQGSAQI